MRIIMTILMIFMIGVMMLVIKISSMQSVEIHSQGLQARSRKHLLTFSGETPVPDPIHYVSHAYGIELAYPQWYDAKSLYQGNINDRLRLLPEQDRQGHTYLVITRLGMIVPVIGLVSDSSFFSTKTPKELERGAVQHISSKEQAIVIAGHTSTFARDAGRYRTIFQSLVLLQTGDIISLYKKNKSDRRSHQDYIFSSREIVTPDQTNILKSGDANNLILYGCYPFGSDAKRIVVGSNRIHKK